MGTLELGMKAPARKEIAFRDYFFKFSDINFGIVLVGIFFLFDFGSFQGVFEIVDTLRLPFILASISVLYATYLIITNLNEFKYETTRRFLFFIIYFLIYSFISTISPERKTTNFTELLQYTANYIIIVNCVRTPTQFILLIDILLASILHSSFHAFMQGGKLYDSIWLRDENHISLIATMGIPFAYIFYNESTSRAKKICYLVCFCFYITVTLVAASRGGGLALAAATLLSMRLYRNKKMRNLFMVVIAVLLIIVFGAKFIYEMGTLKEGTREGTASSRIHLWGLALEMFYDHPIIGVGPMNYTERFPEYDRGKLNPESPETKYAAHSTPMEWLAEMGVIGTIVFLLLQASLYKNWKVVKINDTRNASDASRINHSFLQKLVHACAISQVAFWVGALFLSLLTYPFYWPLIALSESCKRIYCNHSCDDSDPRKYQKTSK